MLLKRCAYFPLTKALERKSVGLAGYLKKQTKPFVIQINTPSFPFGKFRIRPAFLKYEATFTERLKHMLGRPYKQVPGEKREFLETPQFIQWLLPCRGRLQPTPPDPACGLLSLDYTTGSQIQCLGPPREKACVGNGASATQLRQNETQVPSSIHPHASLFHVRS